MQNHRNAPLFIIAVAFLVLLACIGVLFAPQHNRADQSTQVRASGSSSAHASGTGTSSQAGVTQPATQGAAPGLSPEPVPTRVGPQSGVTPTSTNVGPGPVATATPTPTPMVSSQSNFNFSGWGWTVVTRHGEYAQGENECNVPGAVSVPNNVLTIITTAQSATCGDFNLDGSIRHDPAVWPYTTGDVQWTSFAFTYGTITYRAKFPPENTGTWPAVWLLGSNCQATNIVTADTGYASCPAFDASGYEEMDLTECFSQTWCQFAIHSRPTDIACNYDTTIDSSWHTYTFVWSPSGVSMSMDGVEQCSYTAAQGFTIPSTPMFLIIQTQTGGIGGNPNNGNLPTTFQVSSVALTQP